MNDKLVDNHEKFLASSITDMDKSQCTKCANWGGGDYCKAFPSGDGIPIEIYNNSVRHATLYNKDGFNDNGIIYIAK